LYCSGFKIEADHLVLGAGETFAALIHHLTTADKKRCSLDGKLTFREFFCFENATSNTKKEESFADLRNCIYFKF
jgi:hypothetical protein